MIIAQHMDPFPLRSFAKRLERLNNHKVVFVQDDTPLESGTIYLLGDTAVLERRATGLWIKKSINHSGFYNPTIDILFESAAKLKFPHITAFLLSGIGSDGAKGMKALKDAGHTTFAQDEATSPVYGMPKAAIEIDATNCTMSIDDVAQHVKGILSC